MGKDTREKILENALEMFANRGYEGTNIRDLSDALGVSKGAMYRHYESKEKLWDSVVDKVNEEYSKNVNASYLAMEAPKSLDELAAITLNILTNTVHDENVIKWRKMLNREQYRDEKVAVLSDRYFISDMEEIFSIIFKKMIEEKLLKDDDNAIMAFEYAATVSALIGQMDRFPTKEKEIVEKGKTYINYFIKVHKYELK